MIEMRSRRLVLLVSLGLALLAGCTGGGDGGEERPQVRGQQFSSEEKRVWAHWYPWIDNRTPQVVGPDTPVAPFNVTDPRETARAMDLAIANGINGFIFYWRGTKIEEIDALFNAADRRPGFSLVPNLIFPAARDSSGTWNGETVKRWVDVALRRWGNRPSFGRRADGRAIFFVWSGTQQTPEQYRTFVARSTISIVGEVLKPEFRGILDGYYRYGVARMAPTTLRDNNLQWRAKTRQLGMEFWATTSPGYDDTWQREPGYTRPRGSNGLRYAQTWEVAVGASPDHIAITSWNEWNEQSHIQEGQQTGRIALDQTKAYSAKFRGA